jgi:phospholipase C
LIKRGAAAGAFALGYETLIKRALAAPSCGTLNDIQHVVILIQENRSFDHYFGSYRGVRGFADPSAPTLTDGSGLTVFAQPGYPGGYDATTCTPSIWTRITAASAPTTSTTAGRRSTPTGTGASSTVL